MMDNGKIRCGVIGAGLLGMRHAEFLAASAKATLLAVSDLRPEVLEKVAARTGARIYPAYEEMLAREKLDLVLVETPDSHHRAPAVATCEAGVRNLVVQKPLSTTVEDGEAILAASRKSGTSVFIWYENRAFATDMATQFAIRAGLIGALVYGDCDTENSINTRAYARAPFSVQRHRPASLSPVPNTSAAGRSCGSRGSGRGTIQTPSRGSVRPTCRAASRRVSWQSNILPIDQFVSLVWRDCNPRDTTAKLASNKGIRIDSSMAEKGQQ
jgi:hypothetical protein